MSSLFCGCTACLVSGLVGNSGWKPVSIAQVVEHPLWEQEVVGSIPGRAIPKSLKMVPVATLLGAQHYKASTGFSFPNKYCS